MTLSSEVRAGLMAAGQGHALERLDSLSGTQAEELGEQLSALDLGLLAHLKGLIKSESGALGTPQPAQIFPLDRDAGQRDHAAQATEEGNRLLAEGKVAFVLVAGGQASRLGYDAPKGAFPIGPVSGRSLFSIHAARLDAARKRHGKAMPWYVMTSPGNDQDTRNFFAQHNHFGLPKEDVTFFSQRMEPALDEDGRVLFSSRASLFLAPNGHGGCLLALKSSGALEDMRARGIEYISYFQVDNPMVRPTDALFIGLHAMSGAGMSSKIVPKELASEKVGVIGLVNGSLQCIEYSDMTPEQLESRDLDGKLSFRAGNIAVHLFTLDFLESVSSGAQALPWHVAPKKMQVMTASGELEEVSGFKFETFVFDALKSSPISIILEVDRKLEFAPVKNKEGVDSPHSSRVALGNMFSQWVEAAGGNSPEALSDGSIPLEIDPLLAESMDDFLAADSPGPQISKAGHLYGP